jgi:hypothetical protein
MPGTTDRKECEKSLPILKYYSIVHLEEPRKIMDTSITRTEPDSSKTQAIHIIA